MIRAPRSSGWQRVRSLQQVLGKREERQPTRATALVLLSDGIPSEGLHVSAGLTWAGWLPAAATTAAAAAAAALLALASFVDAEFTAVQLGAVELINGGLGLIIRAHLDEGEAS